MMNKATIRKAKTRLRKYPGEAEAVPLISWLNEENPTDEKQQARANVLRAMELLRRMRETAQTVGGRKPSQAWLRNQAELVELFYAHTHSDRVDPDGAGGLKWSVVLNKEVSLLDVPGESEAMATIRDLDRLGVLAQVRQCPCTKYFYVRFPRREHPVRFHSVNCRVKFWETSEARIKQKRKKAKDRYQSRKELELGSRKAAQPKERKI